MQANDVVVSSWAELMNALYDIPRTVFQRYRSDFVYRGVADHSWGLETILTCIPKLVLGRYRRNMMP
jgi:hypothetical protein